MTFAFLKYCLGNKVDINNVVVDINWQQLYTFASKQSLLGFCFNCIERLGKEYSEELKKNPIERDLLITWMGAAQQIRRQNMKVNVVASKLYSMLRENVRIPVDTRSLIPVISVHSISNLQYRRQS